MTRVQAIAGLDARTYERHPLHGEASDWPEKNCYADLWIELLHALALEPLAMLGHTLAVDFEGDHCLIPPNSFALGETVEYLEIPRDVIAICVGKSNATDNPVCPCLNR